MRKKRLTPPLVMALLAALGIASADLSVGAQSLTLQGGVDHAEELPGLDDRLQVGRVYSDDLLMDASIQPNNEWFMIPPWYAGVRHSDDAIIVSRYEYATGRTSSPMQRQLNRQDSLSGFQTDAGGNIWDYKRVPSIQHVESDFCDAVLYVKQITPISGSPNQLVIKYVEVSVSYNKRNKKILQVVQQEQINTITSPQPGSLRINVSVKSYGWDGKPQRQEESVIMANIAKPYKQIDEFEGRQLRPLFISYLQSHNLTKLIPKDN